MLTRFAVLSLVLALNFPGCEKEPATSSTKKGATSSTPAANSVALAPVTTPVPTPAAPAIDQNAQVIIFGYHRFEKTVHRPDTEMTPEMFEAQMKELKDKNIPVIGMQDLLAWKRGEKSIPPRAAVITFDDGWKTQYEVGWPIMKKYGYPFTLFIYTEGVKGMKYGGGAAMSWEMLAEMRDAGVDIQLVEHQTARRRNSRSDRDRCGSEPSDRGSRAIGDLGRQGRDRAPRRAERERGGRAIVEAKRQFGDEDRTSVSPGVDAVVLQAVIEDGLLVRQVAVDPVELRLLGLKGLERSRKPLTVGGSDVVRVPQQPGDHP